MKKRMLSLLLCLCMALTLLPTTALAEGNVTTINLTVTAPEVGKTPSTEASVPSTASTEVQSVSWSGELDENGCFKAGGVYTVTVDLKMKDGVDKNFISSASLIIRINGERSGSISAKRVDDKHVRISYPFKELPGGGPKPGVLTDLPISIEPPKATDFPATVLKNAESLAKIGLQVKDIKWYGQFAEDGSFWSGTEGYYVCITLRFSDDVNTVFADLDRLKTQVQDVFGEWSRSKSCMPISLSKDKKELVVFLNFGATPDRAGIRWDDLKLNLGDSVKRSETTIDSNVIHENITTKTYPSSDTVQPYSWVVTEFDVRPSKESHVINTPENIQAMNNKEEVIGDDYRVDWMAKIKYTDPRSAHVTLYQWIGAAEGEQLTDKMKEVAGRGVSQRGNLYAEIATGSRRNYLSSKSDAYAYIVPSMASGSAQVGRLDGTVHILDKHAEKDFPGAVGQWYKVKIAEKIAYVPAAYVSSVKDTGYWDGAPIQARDSRDVTFAGGSGTKEDPYLISTPEQLNAINSGMDKYYKLINDIDLSQWGNWLPIGGTPAFGVRRGSPANGNVEGSSLDGERFRGQLDGNGHVISGMTITVDRAAPYKDDEMTQRSYGLFASLYGGSANPYGGQNSSEEYTVVKDLGIINYTINVRYSKMPKTSWQWAGALAGCADACCVSNCYSAGGTINLSLTGAGARFNVGGLIGDSNYSYIKDCYNTSSITVNAGDAYEDIKYVIRAGGILGHGQTDWIVRCFNTGNITVDYAKAGSRGIAGGIIAETLDQSLSGLHHQAPEKTVQIMDCYNTGAMQANVATGIAGYAQSDTYVTRCYNVGKLVTDLSRNPIGQSQFRSGAIIDPESLIASSAGSYVKSCGVNAVSGDAWQNSSKLGRKVLRSNPEDSLKIPTVTPAAPSIPAANTAYPSTQTVDLDGKKVSFQMYALKDANGNPTNYVKVRDLALALNGTKAQFSVDWNGAVNLVAGSVYAANGSENQTPFSGERAYSVPTSPTNVNGAASDLVAIYLVDDAGGGYTYYQLRDLGRKLGFNVDWSAERGVFIETGKPYTDED